MDTLAVGACATTQIRLGVHNVEAWKEQIQKGNESKKLDNYAVQSFERGITAQESNAFAWEIVPVEVSGGRGRPSTIVDKDEGLGKVELDGSNEDADFQLGLFEIIEDTIGSIPVDRISIEEESSWILRQLASNINPLFSEAKSYGLVDTVNSEATRILGARLSLLISILW